jgi:acyl-coenzyme A synthetase/AMP-(fatty) acid ligase
VNVGGLKVNPGEVEIALLACPGVREARVYGRRNSVVGYILCAEVVADHGFSETAARAWLADRLQPAKIPRMIKTVAEIARTRTGKVLRA